MPTRISRRMFIAGATLVSAGIAIDQYDRILQLVSQYGISALAAGRDVSVAVRDGQVYAWGKNDVGQCDVPRGLPPITQVSAGAGHVVALGRDGDVFVWGGQSYTLEKLPPIVQVVALDDAHTSVLLADDYQTFYIFRDDNTSSQLPEVRKWVAKIKTISNNPVASGAVLFIDNEGNAGAFALVGSNKPMELVEVLFDTPVIQMSQVTTQYISWVLGVTSVGALVMPTGVKNYGNDKSETQSISQDDLDKIETEFMVSKINNVREIVATPQSAFFTVSTQGMVDYHTSAQVDPTTTSGLRPPFPRNTTIRLLVSAQSHALALTTAGELFAWGSNDYGQCDIPRQLLR